MTFSSPTPSVPHALPRAARFEGVLRRVRHATSRASDTLEHCGRRHPWLTAAVLVAGLLGLALTLLVPRYQTNDDAWMAMIVAGQGIALEPDPHLVFSNIVLGRLLVALYSALPGVPWYGLHLYLLQFAANTALAGGAILVGGARRATALFTLYFAIAGLHFSTQLQFTTTAFLAAGAGLLLCLIHGWRRLQQPAVNAPSLLVGGVTLALWGSLVRFDSFLLALAIAAVPACVLLAATRSLRAVWPSTIAVAVGLGLALAAHRYNGACYERDPAWRGFYAYNGLRLKFNDYRWTTYTPETAAVFAEAGWSENDHAMIAHWYFDDARLFSESRLRRVLDGYSWQAERLTLRYWRTAFRELLRDKAVWMIGLTLPLVLTLLRASRSSQLALGATLAATALFLVAIAAATKPPPSRIYLPALSFALALGVLLPSRAWMPKSCCLAPARPMRRGIGLLICLILAGVAVGMNTSRLAKQSRRTVAARADLERYTRQLAPHGSELYVTWASSYPFELLSPFDNLQSFADFHVFALSWPQATPVQQRLKQHFGVADIPRALYERADVKMIAEKDLWPLYARYVEEHHGLLVEIRPAGRAPGLQPEIQGSMRLASPISWRGITR